MIGKSRLHHQHQHRISTSTRSQTTPNNNHPHRQRPSYQRDDSTSTHTLVTASPPKVKEKSHRANSSWNRHNGSNRARSRSTSSAPTINDNPQYRFGQAGLDSSFAILSAPFDHHPSTSSSASFYTTPPKYPRRRLSLSVTAHGIPIANPYEYPQPTAYPTVGRKKERAWTMSLSLRNSRRRRHDRNRDDDDRPKSTRTRKIVITLLVLLSLVLVGTVVVLSSVSYYLGIPSWAYLTESEVSWRPQDVIKPLLDPAAVSTPARRTHTHQRRQEWREVGETSSTQESEVEPSAVAVDGVLGTEALPESWKELEQEMEELDAEEESEDSPSYDDSVESSDVTPETTVVSSAGAQDEQVSSGEWGIDGEGSGGYWMKEEWDGRVQGVDSWERLYNVTNRPGETIPRLIHQTWKSDHLPEKWQKAWKECREGMPDYEYMLWTDDLSREFIAKHYPAHLHMFDTYKYPIQRADSIRYFILHHFGGVYMDLDIGCRRRLDPLLQGDWEVILPITKPVGVSNDLIFSSKGSAFMDDTIHGLSTFNHQYLTNYPTVMFSTGPMFLSAQYALYSSAHPLTETHPRAEIRILPKSLYGKNTPMSTVPHSFFSHFYGSSWHSDDAGFITFLGSWGKGLMWVGLVVIVLGAIRLIWVKRKAAAGQQYQLLSLLPTSATGHGHGGHRSGASTPTGSSHSSDPMSPSSTYGEMGTLPQHLPSDIASVFKRAGNLILAAPATLLSGDKDRRGGRRRTGLLYFVPALFQPGPVPRSRGRTASEASQLPLRRSKRDRVPPPPPYEPHPASGGTPRSRSPLKAVGDNDNDDTMDEVDAFLHEADTEGESSSYADADADADAEADVESEREWAEWNGTGADSSKDGGR